MEIIDDLSTAFADLWSVKEGRNSSVKKSWNAFKEAYKDLALGLWVRIMKFSRQPRCFSYNNISSKWLRELGGNYYNRILEDLTANKIIFANLKFRFYKKNELKDGEEGIAYSRSYIFDRNLLTKCRIYPQGQKEF